VEATRTEAEAAAWSGIRTVLVPQDIVGVHPSGPAGRRRNEPCAPHAEGQVTTARCGDRDWFSDHLFVESQDGHARSGYGTSITVHLAAVAALIAFLLAQPDIVTISVPSLPMPAIIASMPPPPIESVSVVQSPAPPQPKTTVDAPAPPPPQRTDAPAEDAAPAPVEAPASVTPETGAEGRVTGGAPGGVPGGVAGGVPGGVVGGSVPSGSGTGTVVRVGANMQPPRKIKDVKPVYPAGALPSRSQGAVVVEATIGPDGKVTAVKVIHSVPALDQAAIDAVRQWEYTPSMVNGVAVSVIVTVVVNFAMQ
jgi:protein TonB